MLRVKVEFLNPLTGERDEFFSDVESLTAEELVAAMVRHDADLIGLSHDEITSEDLSGYEVEYFGADAGAVGEAAFALRTVGMGPTDAENFVVVGVITSR